jgi:HAD superfamily hydrolase (TIGR01509 family)
MGDFWQQAKSVWGITNESSFFLTDIWHSGYMIQNEVCEIIESLSQQGNEVLYFSGSTKERADYLECKYHFTSLFDGGIFSFNTGYRKPALAAFQAILEIASNPPHNCVYIDDKEKYLPPARELGMQTILFSSRQDLEALLINQDKVL